jgi:hypothetical protein
MYFSHIPSHLFFLSLVQTLLSLDQANNYLHKASVGIILHYACLVLNTL